jgi:integrase
MTDLVTTTDAASAAHEPEADEVAARLETLDQLADERAAASLSEQTWRLYGHDWAAFTGWCRTAGATPLPASPATVRRFLADLSAQVTQDGAWCYQPATLRRRLAGIAAAHREAGEASPTRDPAVTRVMVGIERERRAPPRRARPLLTEDIRAILAGMTYRSWPAGVTAARDAFVLLAGFAGALRRAELTALSTDDVVLHPHDGLHVSIRTSKTDQTGRGALVALPYGEHAGTCPVCAYLRWTSLLATTENGRAAAIRRVRTTPAWTEWSHLCTDPDVPELPAGVPLLRGVRTGGEIGDAAVTGEALRVMVKRRARAAGLDDTDVSFHSLRAGFVTQARRNGAEHRAVRRQTRHSSDAMVELYDRDQAPLLGNAVTTLGI